MRGQTASSKPAPGTRAGADRRQHVGDAAIEVLAERGARGLTHRAVDEAAGLPQGSTSNVFRSRAALLEGTLRRHAQLDLGAGPDLDTLEALPALGGEQATQLLAAGVESVLGRQPRAVARFELLLESTRRPELEEQMESARAWFARGAERLLAATGCEQPASHARQLLAVLDGIVVADLHGGDAALTGTEIRELIGRVLMSC